MKTPEEALERARAAAAERRAAGGYAQVEPSGPLEGSFTSDIPDTETLVEWAEIAVEPDTLFSTRRGGAPITTVKRFLLRLLRQYLVELEAQQTRFNISVVTRLGELEARLQRVERAAAERPDEPAA